MKIVFVSNFLNHHQIPLCEEIRKKVDEFYFIATDNGSNQGYQVSEESDYLIDLNKDTDMAEKEIMSADAVIFGACPTELLRKRILSGKLSFIFSERVWKKGTYRRFIPFIRKKVTDKFLNKPNVYILGASCYLASDLKLLGFSMDKCYTWGYFPEFEELNAEQIMSSKPKEIHIAWVGRFIPLKHCEDVLRALGQVKRDGYNFIFDLVGDGESRSKYEKIILDENITENVKLWGSLSHNEVRDVMKKSHIFIFSSDFKEGWGAVVNEAMNSVCAPIVSHAAGSSAFLISNNENGLIYRSGDIENLKKKIEQMLDDRKKREKLALNAYHTIKNDFNCVDAAERFVNFTECVLSNKTLPKYEFGPLSLSPIVKNDWFKG